MVGATCKKVQAAEIINTPSKSPSIYMIKSINNQNLNTIIIPEAFIELKKGDLFNISVKKLSGYNRN